jgi:hypothetical protein
MARRKHELLTETEGEQLIGIPATATTWPGFTLSSRTISASSGSAGERETCSGLRFSLHCCGTQAQLLLDRKELPGELVTFVAAQLGLPPALLADYAARDQTMTDHARALAAKLGMRGPVRSDISLMISAAASAAWSTDKGITIVGGVITCLRNAGIVLPSISTIERASIAGRARARKQAAEALVSPLSADQLLALDRLFDEAADRGISRLTWLKAIPHAVKPNHIRQIGIPAEVASAIHIDRYRQFVREGRVSATYMIERYTKARR